MFNLLLRTGLSILVTCIGAGNLHAQQETGVPMISVPEFRALLRELPTIVDVRMNGERHGTDGKPWRLRCPACPTFHAPFDLDMGFVEDGDDRVVKLGARKIVVVCRQGVRALRAAIALRSRGLKTMLLHGGLDALPDAMLVGKRPQATQ